MLSNALTFLCRCDKNAPTGYGNESIDSSVNSAKNIVCWGKGWLESIEPFFVVVVIQEKQI